MSVDTTYQRKCDRCTARIGEPFHVDTDSEDREPILSLEASDLGIPLKTIKDLCEKCKTVMPGLLKKAITAAPAKVKQGKKDEGKS